MIDLPPLKEVIARHGLDARKKLGQHFLLDPGLIGRIVQQAGQLDGRHVVEVGPGPGGLTRALLASGATDVLAVELDRRAIAALTELEAAYPHRLTVMEADATRLQGDGRTVVHVAQAGRVIGLIAIADAIRPTSKAAIAKLRERKIQVVMLTGDNAATAKRIAADLGIDTVLADVLPAQKAAKIKELQATGKKVGMVGDGVNDAPALTQANVGFAIGAGTDVAMESADVVLMKSDPYDIVGAIELSHATLRKMHQNLWWAVGYNAIAFPLAAGVLYPFVLSPEVAALSMSGSTLVVAINALLLKRTKLAGIKTADAIGAQQAGTPTPPSASA